MWPVWRGFGPNGSGYDPGRVALVFEVCLRGDWGKGVLKNYQQTFAERLVDGYGMEFSKSVSFLVGMKLPEFDKSKEPPDWPFCRLVDSLM